MDARVKPGHDEGKNERKERIRRRNADRGKASSAVPYGHGRALERQGAHLSAFHRGSRPKESFIGKGLSTRPGFLRRGGDTFCASL